MFELVATVFHVLNIQDSFASVSVISSGRIDEEFPTEPDRRSDLSRRARIVGGTPVVKGEIPWQVAVRRDHQQVCGGAVISSNFVLTTAHCFRKKGRYELSSGIIDVTQPGQLRSIERTILHPSWRIGAWENDIALLKVNESFRFDTSTAPLRLPSAESPGVVSHIVVSGWGRLLEGYRQSTVLHKVTLSIEFNENCKKRFPYAFSDRTMFCALSEGKDACQGDSGGAAFAVDGNTSVLVGLVSWGRGCARNNTPGVYTKVSSFLSWISETINMYGDNKDKADIMMKRGKGE